MAAHPPFDLTQEAFDRLLVWLHPDREQAGVVFETLRDRLRKLFHLQGCLTAEEAADETLARVARKIVEGVEIQAGNPYTYIQGVARNVLREYWKNRAPATVPLPVAPGLNQSGPNPEEQLSQLVEQQLQETRLACLESCLAKLPGENRELFETYHRGSLRDRIDARERLAAELGIPLSALRLRIHRMREKLESCINGCVTLRQIKNRSE